MRASLGIGTIAGLGVIVAMAAGAPARPGASSGAQAAAPDVTARIVTAAQAFVATLDEAGRKKVQFAFDSPQRSRWSNLPIGIFERGGVRMGDLTDTQRTAALALLSTAFSQDGYRKIMGIVRGDEMLLSAPRGGGPGGPQAGGAPAGGPPPGQGGGPSGGGGGRVRFGQDEYYLAFVGTPSVTTPWILQFGGHHLAINLTVVGRRATLAPTHTGAQPATYSFEGRTVRPLGNEVDRAFALMASLDEGQRMQAILGSTMADLVLGPGKDGATIQPEGLRASAMSAAQQAMLIDLIREWAGIAADALAAPRIAEIRSKLPETWFAWSGPTTVGSAAYFRIQGPTLVIEYAPQRGVDHIHTIYRDPTNDYGAAYATQ